ncbi:hypothetical protein ABNQ38_31970 [Azospirillum sp. A29]|jgi:hypothetical protein
MMPSHGLGDDLAIGFHSAAEVAGQVDFEADQLAGRRHGIPGREGAFSGDTELLSKSAFA